MLKTELLNKILTMLYILMRYRAKNAQFVACHSLRYFYSGEFWPLDGTIVNGGRMSLEMPYDPEYKIRSEAIAIPEIFAACFVNRIFGTAQKWNIIKNLLSILGSDVIFLLR